MYVELYILDNLLMNALILRLAACICGIKARGLRIFILSFSGAIYALLALFFEWLMHPIAKLLLCAIMAIGLSFKCIREFLINCCAVFFSTLLAGGLTYASALSFGGSIKNGYIVTSIPLRVAICVISTLVFLPGFIRRIRRRLRQRSLKMNLVIKHEGEVFQFTALLDTGSSLHEPVSGLPGILVISEALKPFASVPVISGGAFCDGRIIYGFRPDSVSLEDQEITAFIFVADGNSECFYENITALIPQDAIPLTHEPKKEKALCTNVSGTAFYALLRRSLIALSKQAASIMSAQVKRCRRH